MLKVNEYFDGHVKSIGFENKGPVSMGVMEVGEYTFGTAAPERMTVVKGELTVKLPGRIEWETYGAGDSFEVPGESSFQVQITQTSAYLCEYL
ncbi:hypothetical protein A1OO_00630 [Enterovibrio norvegicus FF-33]|uniref:Pyrimidine/purine nucleoside phosphorylase n=1 Tax=Enterovibrio norvegicus FF-454 TaxID=1185651 RepID=A0A1E5CEX2_9GAMM|nr:pyrimidine/purine nucleoside phosphorylase [Enterovibrio norvegicus]OEE64056.1 hypothetical protein A1OK_06010 [Enterovibrio norvegicus FF-454]OEE69407.1 hypothetical protein A1OO_00630 [Enterovibrio norvegicus FF-33]OEE89342.1 hypothetical protein A1OQ_11830 [Enterovibrio norvegicus FF-162]